MVSLSTGEVSGMGLASAGSFPESCRSSMQLSHAMDFSLFTHRLPLWDEYGIDAITQATQTPAGAPGASIMAAATYSYPQCSFVYDIILFAG